jgi:hypothetical protein
MSLNKRQNVFPLASYLKIGETEHDVGWLANNELCVIVAKPSLSIKPNDKVTNE